MTARRAVPPILAALVAVWVALALRSGNEPPRGDAPRPAPPAEEPRAELAAEARVSGTVTGRYGPLAAVLVIARAEGAILAETASDDDGRYRLELPARVELEIEAAPRPDTALAPVREALVLAAGEERTVDLRLSSAGSAAVLVEGAPTMVDLVAIRVEDYPAGDPPSIGDLEAAPKLGARTLAALPEEPPTLDALRDGFPAARCSYVIDGLEPDATYRLAVLDRAWAVMPPGLVRLGDEVTVRLEPVLRLFVAVTDVETGEPVARFGVSLVDGSEVVLESLEGGDGRLSRTFSGDRARVTTLVISAEGYREERRPAHGAHHVALQRSRKPNVLLRIAYDDGTAYDGEIEARFESIEDPDGLVEAPMRKEEPGRFRTTLPPGKWRLHVKRPRAFHDVTEVADVEVPPAGAAEASLRYRRGGAVTFERNATLTRRVEGEWERVLADEGAWEDVPPGTYRVMNGEDVVSTFDVLPGSTQFVQVPARRLR